MGISVNNINIIVESYIYSETRMQLQHTDRWSSTLLRAPRLLVAVSVR